MTPADAASRLVRSSLLHRLATTIGQEAFLVGGALRDRLLGWPTHDLDLVVMRDPEGAARRLARAMGGQAFPLGKPPLVTWRVVTGRHELDLWRVEASLHADIWRRDLTVNALFWGLPRGPLVDLTGGLDDLAAWRLRVVRSENLSADPLRVLRAVRLMSTHPCFGLTAESERQVAAAAHGLADVASERVVEEVRRLLGGPGAGKALAVAARLGILAALVPAWSEFGAVAEVTRLAGALAGAQRRERGWQAGGAALVAPALLAAPVAGFPGGWDSQGASGALRRVGYPPRAATRIATAAAWGERLGGAHERGAVREVALEAGELLPAALAWAAARDPRWEAEAASLLRWHRGLAHRRPWLGGEEIAALLDLPAGPLRAKAAHALRLAQVRGDVRSRRQAEAFLRDWRAR